MRQKIVALVKVARACNKYSMDLHTVILDLDKESKTFADYVSRCEQCAAGASHADGCVHSAYERASRAAAAASSSSGSNSPSTERSTMARPVRLLC
jgi:hypothetical protein